MITAFINSILEDCQQGIFNFKDLEKEIRKRLKKFGYKDLTKQKKRKNYKAFLNKQKDNILNSNKVIENPFKNKGPCFIYQPFNEQSFPDFLIFENDIVIAFEVKSSTKGENHPMWNGGLPRSNALYLFVSKKDNNFKGVTFFKGEFLLSEEQNKKIELYWKILTSVAKILDKWLLENALDIQITPYLRKAHNQRISCFGENQSKREKDTLAWLTTVES